MNILSLESKKELISKIIDIIIILKLDDTYFINGRKKDFLIQNILLNTSGVNINSPKAVKHIMKEMKFSSQYVYNYRKFLKDIGWFVPSEDGLELQKFVNFKILPENIDFNFRLSLNGQQHNSK